MKLTRELVSAHGMVLEVRKECRALERLVLPRAKKSFHAIQEGFKQGKFRYLDVLDAQKTFFAVKRRYVKVLGMYHKAVADVEAIMGVPMSSVQEKSGRTRQDKHVPPNPSSSKKPRR